MPPRRWNNPPLSTLFPQLHDHNDWRRKMIGKILGAADGRHVEGLYRGRKGMIRGAMSPMIARRAFGPLGLALAGGWAAKKYYDSRRMNNGYRADRSR